MQYQYQRDFLISRPKHPLTPRTHMLHTCSHPHFNFVVVLYFSFLCAVLIAFGRLSLQPVCPGARCCRTEMETSHKGEKKAAFPLYVGQEVRGFVTIKMIFRCSSYVTVCYKAVITGQGTPLSGSGALFFPLSQLLFLSEKKTN